MLPFSPDVKTMPAYFFFFFFFQFPRLSERISCDPNPDSLSLNRRNEIVCIAPLLLYKIMIYSSFSFMRSRIRTGQNHADPCGSGSETLHARQKRIFMPWAKLLLLCCRQKQTRLDFSVWHM